MRYTTYDQNGVWFTHEGVQYLTGDLLRSIEMTRMHGNTVVLARRQSDGLLVMIRMPQPRFKRRWYFEAGYKHLNKLIRVGDERSVDPRRGSIPDDLSSTRTWPDGEPMSINDSWLVNTVNEVIHAHDLDKHARKTINPEY